MLKNKKEEKPLIYCILLYIDWKSNMAPNNSRKNLEVQCTGVTRKHQHGDKTRVCMRIFLHSQ